MNTTTTNHYAAEFARVAKTLAGQNNAWLQQMRTEALQSFSANGFPTLHDEDWKYTSVAAIEKINFQLAKKTQAASISNELITTLPYLRLVFINGHFAAEFSQLQQVSSDITIASLAQILNQAAGQAEPYLGKTLTNASNSFMALNTAFLQDGAFIHLKPNAQCAGPIHLIFITTDQAENKLINLRNLIIAENNSKATIIESYIGLNTKASFTNVVSEIIIEDHANIEHYKLQQESEKTYHIGNVQVQQQAHSSFTTHSFALGGLLVRSDTNVNLAAERAMCSLNGLYLAHHRQHMDHHTLINHAKPHGTSREYYKGVLTDRARAVFNGKVIVALDAQKTDAQQTNKNLLLSPDAEIDTKPQLEIFADDVKCTHGAAIGQLDNDALFYLRSRGMNEQEARNVLIYAFIRELVENIPLLPVRDYLQEKLLKIPPNPPFAKGGI